MRALVLLLALTACAPRAQPYRFRISALAPPLRTAGNPVPAPIHRAPAVTAGHAPRRAVPARHRAPESAAVPAAVPVPVPDSGSSDTLADALRARVGTRTTESSTRFALGIAQTLAPLAPDVLAADDGPTLRVAAASHRAMFTSPAPLPGDLVLLDDDALVALVVGATANGAIEILYVRRKIVRRGYLSLATPDRKRDGAGRVLNTFVRPYLHGDRRGQAYLGGALFGGWVRLTALGPTAADRQP